MREDKNIAISLRRDGKSYNEISKKLKVSKGTLSDWLHDDPQSIRLKLKLTKEVNPYRIQKFVEANRIKWQNWREAARRDARNEFKNLSKNPLFIAGLMLYWAEGDSKPENPVRMTNTAPGMIKLYVKFLTKILGIPESNLRAAVIIYPDLSNDKCIDFWSAISEIPKSQFHKTQIIGGRHPTKRLSNGICMIYCGNRQLKEKFLVWIDLLSKKL